MQIGLQNLLQRLEAFEVGMYQQFHATDTVVYV